MPGVLIEGGPRGLDEDRACRRRAAEGASLRGSAWGPSERIAISATEDIVAVPELSLFSVSESAVLEGFGGEQDTLDARNATFDA